MTAEELLASYIPGVRDLALQLRALALSIIPDAVEIVDPFDKLIAYGYGPRMADIVCTIMPYKGHVNLGIANAATLLDPAGLLEGTGKRHRHVKVRTSADVERPALRALLEAAVAARQSNT